MSSGSKVAPGEVVGVIEEYVEGRNVYSDAATGYLRSSVAGRVVVNGQQKVIDVVPAKRVKAPTKGSVVVGMVSQIREGLAFVDLYGEVELEPRPRWVHEFSGFLSGVLVPEQIGMGRNDDIYDYVRPMDIVVARVLSTINPYLLTIRAPQLGVLYAFCSRCGELMVPSGGAFVCPRCGNVERRKISSLASSRLLRIDLRRLAAPSRP